ncbi:hypothetical protein [Chryseobacterium taihuense]|nr:hypothetical protein [Chryseobacterium taihuense]SDL65923.1 hypothetical protein SAMN05216273_10469 [Chryseobacterium taihuense]
MKKAKLFLGSLMVVAAMYSCNKVTEKAPSQPVQTSEKVQKVIDELGLVYVEEGAQDIITYDEVNAAQQAWCDALVKIGKIKEE